MRTPGEPWPQTVLVAAAAGPGHGHHGPQPLIAAPQAPSSGRKKPSEPEGQVRTPRGSGKDVEEGRVRRRAGPWADAGLI